MLTHSSQIHYASSSLSDFESRDLSWTGHRAQKSGLMSPFLTLKLPSPIPTFSSHLFQLSLSLSLFFFNGEIFFCLGTRRIWILILLFFWFLKLGGQFSSVTSKSLQPHGLQHTRPPCPSPTPRVYSNSCPSSQWCYPIISFSVIPFSHLQSFPASGSFQMSQLFTSGGQSIGVSASASVLPMNIQDWFSLGLTGWISLQSKGLSRVFSNTTVQKHQFFSAQLSLYFSVHIHTWPLEKP